MNAMADSVIVIPARRASTRLPDKPLRLLAGRPLIEHVIRRAQAVADVEIIIATDDQAIADVASRCGVRAEMTRTDHRTGSDRIAEVAMRLGWPDDRVVVNLQGDEPMAPVSGVIAVARTLRESAAPMATLAIVIDSVAELVDPNVVKVVRNLAGNALLFSRAPVPWLRDTWQTGVRALPESPIHLRHIGLYAYRAGFLRTLAGLEPTPIERSESLEQMRVIEHGHDIAVGMAAEPFPAGIDTLEDLERAERQFAQCDD